MSSLAAAQADGFYHPPEYDPRRHGGLSKYNGSTGSNQWEKRGIVRFELPYNAWCLGCKRAIGQGTRYNAKKEKAGKYFTTQIWEFHTKCATCPQKFVIRTDPKNADYEFVSGLKRIDSQPSAESAETIALLDDKTKERLETDPLFSLEYTEGNKIKAARHAKQIVQLQALNDATKRDDFKMNRALRAKARDERKRVQKLQQEGKQLGLPFSLVPEDADSVSNAKKAISSRSKVRKISDVFQYNELGKGMKEMKEVDTAVQIKIRRRKKRKKQKTRDQVSSSLVLLSEVYKEI
uniref:Coiled-coil domain-containing protein 130 n=1 Tax=Aplanochytrium stocchinoi TaxID=215587 RepID=A0A7S3PEB4_9STRA|mmetsp:Transcript_6280/g.7910  ORF Transcript_6280/g.7910 Transcript_6280/m.7910 type:complete len:293 (-) Transcript_6280:1177-2055(-)|eukprot:CAMPEP_0204855298 /NCGR_PEP_ID=MMETSP1347-20130617/16540_1 /ASSEMBLY_ACC=CAM_ASM_000690 /TAXON_ID=215587 /ORGANISM="Aplanochytrium stocchinoi, Strain GSBS06" /LENGTH=292 /DNA_ID=CAMNT_0052001353 /DNA_START=379 /DNA_END=1257 /DNA_ORIENTATION=+